MYKYQITLTDGTLIVANSTYSHLFTTEIELKENDHFVRIGNAIVRKSHIQSIVEVEVDE